MSNKIKSIEAIAYAISGCFFSALALILMKLAHNKNINLKREGINKPIVCNPYWIMGFLSLILGSVLNVFAIGYGNVMFLSCMSGLSIIFNTIFAVVFLGEKLLIRRIIGIIFVITGSILFLSQAKNT